MKKFIIAAVFALALSASHAWAISSCPAHFLNGKVPSGSIPVQLLCSQKFAVGYDSSLKEPRWSAEHLTFQNITEARALHGRSTFHPDPRLASDRSAELEDYHLSGWTRGHMTPSGDMPTKESRFETYALSNIVPQNGRLNSGAWEHLESQVRQKAIAETDLYVVTGPAFLNKEGTIGFNKLKIPSHIWKAVYEVRNKAGWAFICENKAESNCEQISLDQLKKKVGIMVFPMG